LCDAVDEAAIVAPVEGSKAATVATTKAVKEEEFNNSFGSNFADNLEGIDWSRLKRFCEPTATAGPRSSWIFRHGYRVARRSDMTQIWFICRWCHQHKAIDLGGAGTYDITAATSAAGKHLGLDKPGHNHLEHGPEQPLEGGARTIAQVVAEGVKVSQGVANAMGGFDQQRFRQAAVMWLIDNNHPLREFNSPSFREMIELANPVAAQALWVSHNSVSAFVMKLFSVLQPHVVEAIQTALSKIHVALMDGRQRVGSAAF
jgi:hypothetical protein